MSYYYTLYNQEVIKQIKADPELSLVFFAMYPPYDDELDPLHRPNWAAIREAEYLGQAKVALKRAKTWASERAKKEGSLG